MDALRNEAFGALDAVPLNTMFAAAALDAGAPLWADRALDARAFHVVHPYGMSFVWGPAVDDAFSLVVAHLAERREGEEWLQVEPRWSGLDWAGAVGAQAGRGDVARARRVTVARHARVSFAFDAGAFAGRRHALVPPEGWEARPATVTDFGWPGSVVPNLFWPDATTFLAAGGGVVLENGDGIGAMSFASYRRGDRLEIGIETADPWRRRGLAAAAAAAMIGSTLADGLTPVWSCRDGNVGSYRLACSLGFRPTTRTPYFHVLATARDARGVI